MNFPALLALLLTLTAGLSYLNARFFKLPPTIGILLGGLGIALIVNLLGRAGVTAAAALPGQLEKLPFDQVVMAGLLSFLLFASAVQSDVRALLRERGVVLALAVVTTLITMLVLGSGLYLVMRLFGEPLTWTQAMLFGAIIAPTDPVAVTPLLEKAGVPHRLRALIAGESLFNDGVGVASFTVLAGAALPQPGEAHASVSLGHISALIAQEMIGGMLLGAALGFVTARLSRSAHSQDTSVLLSLALITGGYSLAELLHVSGPVTVAAAGVTLILTILIGHKQRKAAGTLTRENVLSAQRIQGFWEITDQVLNAVLFVMMALEVLVLKFRAELLPVGLGVALLTLAARALGVWLPLTAYNWRVRQGLNTSTRYTNIALFAPYTRRLMTWAGLRGGVALALVFGLPHGELRDTLMFLTYTVVLFSLLVQGLTVPVLGRKAARASEQFEAQQAGAA